MLFTFASFIFFILLFDACNRKLYTNSTKQKKEGKRSFLQRALMNARNTNNLIPKKREMNMNGILYIENH